MTLTSTSQFVKKHLWLVIPIFLITILSTLIYYQFNNIKLGKLSLQEAIPIDSLALSTNGFTFSKNLNQKAPTKLPLYEKSEDSNLVNIGPSISKKLKIDAEAKAISDIKRGDGLSFSSPNGYLQIYKNYLYYQKRYPRLPVIMKNNLDVQTLRSKSMEFLSSLELPGSLPKKYTVAYKHFTPDDSYMDSRPENASLTMLTFSHELATLPIISTNYDTSVEFDKSGEVYTVTFSYYSQPDATADYPIIDSNKAMANLNRGTGYLIKMDGPALPNAYSSKSINSATIQRLYLAYYNSAKSKIIQPVWVFEGTSQFQNIPLELTYVVPAINPQFIKHP